MYNRDLWFLISSIVEFFKAGILSEFNPIFPVIRSKNKAGQDKIDGGSQGSMCRISINGLIFSNLAQARDEVLFVSNRCKIVH